MIIDKMYRILILSSIFVFRPLRAYRYLNTASSSSPLCDVLLGFFSLRYSEKENMHPRRKERSIFWLWLYGETFKMMIFSIFRPIYHSPSAFFIPL
jgi:hypothetical protein